MVWTFTLCLAGISCSRKSAPVVSSLKEHYWVLESAFSHAWEIVDALEHTHPREAQTKLSGVKQALHTLQSQTKSTVDAKTNACLQHAFKQREAGIVATEKALSHGADFSLEMAQAYRVRRNAEEAVLRCLPSQ